MNSFLLDLNSVFGFRGTELSLYSILVFEQSEGVSYILRYYVQAFQAFSWIWVWLMFVQSGIESKVPQSKNTLVSQFYWPFQILLIIRNQMIRPSCIWFFFWIHNIKLKRALFTISTLSAYIFSYQRIIYTSSIPRILLEGSTLHCCRWGYVTMTTAVYSLNSITLASALKSTVEWAIAVLPYP